MGAERADVEPFDLAAALSRQSGGDAKAFAEALAARLAPALPGRVAVERRRDGLFSSTSHVSSIAVRFDDALLVLKAERGSLSAQCAKVVRGVTIGTRDMPVADWLADVVRRTQALGEGAGSAHAALQDFLLG
jgi:hypothetical protein